MLFSLRRVRFLRLIYLGIIILFVYFVLIRGNVLYYIIGGVRSAFMGESAEQTYSAEEAADIQKRNNELEALTLYLSEENYFLRKKLELNDAAPLYGLPYILADYIRADVAYTDHGAIFRSATLNKGSSDGVAKGDPVVGLKGLVGKVVEVRENYCDIYLLTNPECRFGAYIKRTRDLGLIVGSGDGLMMEHLSKQTDVRPGDIVVTSRESGLTPMGILIGEVDQVEEHEDEQMLVVTIKPATDFTRLNSVIILKYLTSTNG